MEAKRNVQERVGRWDRVPYLTACPAALPPRRTKSRSIHKPPPGLTVDSLNGLCHTAPSPRRTCTTTTVADERKRRRWGRSSLVLGRPLSFPVHSSATEFWRKTHGSNGAPNAKPLRRCRHSPEMIIYRHEGKNNAISTVSVRELTLNCRNGTCHARTPRPVWKETPPAADHHHGKEQSERQPARKEDHRFVVSTLCERVLNSRESP